MHNLHKYETLSVSDKIHKQTKNGKKYKKIKTLCECMKKDDDKVMEHLEEMAIIYRHEDEEERHLNPNQSLANSTDWEIWKTQMTVYNEV